MSCILSYAKILHQLGADTLLRQLQWSFKARVSIGCLTLTAHAGVFEPTSLAAVRHALHDRKHATEVQNVRAHFQAAFAEEHQSLLAEIEHMQL